ncbi:MAG: hypothetical protein OD815_001002 [Candidatus Alkanophagales archaeon MCA70_species_2]|nr:hypothetical protein [Candidatus Alkanophaga liquidiphilum]
MCVRKAAPAVTNVRNSPNSPSGSASLTLSRPLVARLETQPAPVEPLLPENKVTLFLFIAAAQSHARTFVMPL